MMEPNEPKEGSSGCQGEIVAKVESATPAYNAVKHQPCAATAGNVTTPRRHHDNDDDDEPRTANADELDSSTRSTFVRGDEQLSARRGDQRPLDERRDEALQEKETRDVMRRRDGETRGEMKTTLATTERQYHIHALPTSITTATPNHPHVHNNGHHHTLSPRLDDTTTTSKSPPPSLAYAISTPVIIAYRAQTRARRNTRRRRPATFRECGRAGLIDAHHGKG